MAQYNEHQVIQAIRNGLQAQSTGCRGGCGRAYICLSHTESKQALNIFKKAVTASGLRYLGKAYGILSKRTAYVGYDNADGRALAQAEQIAKNLKQLGLDCYYDCAGD